MADNNAPPTGGINIPSVGSGSSSSSSSSSGGGSSAPKVDPVIAQKASQFQSIYQQIWGEPAPTDYLMAAAKQGLNTWEFAFQERSKPAYIGSKGYKDQVDQWASLLHQMGVV